MTEPIIDEAYALVIRIGVKPYRTTDRRGREVEVHYFERDTGFVSAYGFRIRKNGEHSKQGIVRLDLGAPLNVASLMLSLLAPFDAVGEGAEVNA